ncbi:MAG: N-acetyltransferase family protein [Candidatus Pelethousia sp.]|nr:N-acetyltransferase family protein [Candidatus Pelethousia sp.]
MSGSKLRAATCADAEPLLAIYAPYVRDMAITFEYEPPALEEFRNRIRKTLSAYPYLVVEGDEGVLGYAYAGPFKSRPAYGWAAETTVYVAETARCAGAGRLLYETLLNILMHQGVQNVYACVTWPNESSIAFHQALGFQRVAHLSRCGYKLGQWWDSVWLQKFLGSHEIPPAPLRPITEVMAAFGLG